MTADSQNSEAYPLISVVFVNWNRLSLLQSAIRSLREQQYLNLEIIVVDNGSVDGSQTWLRTQKDIRCIENRRNRGASVARNQGTRIARGEYILYMDSDAELRTEKALLHLVNYLKQNQEVAGVSGVYFSDEALQNLWCWSPCMDDTGIYDRSASLSPHPNPQTLSTCFVLFRRSALSAVGGFDEYFFYLYEDADLCERLRKKSYRLHVDPAIKILHRYAEPGRTQRDSLAYHYYHEHLRMYFLLKNWGFRRFIHCWWLIVRSPQIFLQQYSYLPIVNFLDIYFVRIAGLLFQYPWLRFRSRWNRIKGGKE